MDKLNRKVPVLNRNNGSTGYYLADSRINRTWQPEEIKYISIKELQQVQWEPGGEYILNNLLAIQDQDAIRFLNMHVEPEYFYDKNKIKEVFWKGSLDEVKDFLDFAPVGAIEIAKQIAVEEKLPDSDKRKAIFNATGFNIDNAIRVNEVMNEESEAEEVAAPEKKDANGRRAAVPTVDSTATPKRRVATTPQYKVVGKKEN